MCFAFLFIRVCVCECVFCVCSCVLCLFMCVCVRVRLGGGEGGKNMAIFPVMLIMLCSIVSCVGLGEHSPFFCLKIFVCLYYCLIKSCIDRHNMALCFSVFSPPF